MPIIRGQFNRKPIQMPLPQQQPQNSIDLGGYMVGVAQLVADLKYTKSDIIDKVDTKLSEIEDAIAESKAQNRGISKKLEAKLAEFEDAVVELIRDFQEKNQSLKAANIAGLNQNEIIDAVLARIPEQKPLDENSLFQKFIAKIPKSKASLKIIQENFESDPVSVIEKIMALPEGKFKLKTSQIDGLEQTISAFRNQLSRGYLHGAGISEVTHDSTLSGKGTVASPLSVLSTGNVSYNEVPSGTIDGSNTIFTIAHTPTVGSVRVYLNGARQNPNVSGDYTITGSTITFVTAPPTTSTLLADYSY